MRLPSRSQLESDRERVTPRHIFRVAFHFGLFQALMPLIGWFVGQSFATYVKSVDHWVAFGLLAFIGGRMLWESRKETEEQTDLDPTRGWMLVMLSVATSIDALAVGLSMAFLGINIWVPAIVIGLVARHVKLPGHHFWRPARRPLGTLGQHHRRLRLDRHRRANPRNRPLVWVICN